MPHFSLSLRRLSIKVNYSIGTTIRNTPTFSIEKHFRGLIVADCHRLTLRGVSKKGISVRLIKLHFVSIVLSSTIEATGALLQQEAR